MSRSLANVNPSTDSFYSWMIQTNKLLEAFSNEIVTANTIANTTGNVQLLGILGANTVVATGNVRGGNVSTSAPLTISSNVSVTGDTLKVGANIQLNTSSFSAGASANLIANSIIVTLSNATNTANLTPGELKIGSSTVNSTVVNVTTANISVATIATRANVGSNVWVTTTDLQIGNSIANAFANSILLRVSNNNSAETSSNLTPGELRLGSAAIINSTVLTISTGNFSTGANVGANVNLTTTGVQIGNSKANVFANSILLRVSNDSSGETSSNLIPGELRLGSAAIVNSTVLTISTGNFSTGANVGANVNLTTSSVKIGNSIVNVFANSSLLRIQNDTPASANLTPSELKIGTTTVNTTAVYANIEATVVNASANVKAPTVFANIQATVVNASANVNTPIVYANISGTYASLSYANVTGQVNTGTLYVTTSANIGTVLTVTSTNVNTSANVFITGTTSLKGVTETVYTITDGAAFEIDPRNGSIQIITLAASRTPKATNFSEGQSVTMMIDDGSAYTITWTDATFGTGGVTWVGGTAPGLATSGYTVIVLWKVGSKVYGKFIGLVA